MSERFDWEPPFVARGHSVVPDKGAFVDVQVRWSNAQVRYRPPAGTLHTYTWMTLDEAKRLASEIAATLGVTSIPYRVFD